LAGLGFNFSAVFIFLPYDTTLTKQFPLWTYLYAAFCIFMYQTFDAIDGK
jgi:hypothetical protein